MNIILLFEKDTIADGRYRLDDHRAEHIRSVLQSQQGDSLAIGLLNGPLGKAIIDTINPQEIILSDLQLMNEIETIPVIDIVCALPRPQTVKKVLFTAAMMGVRNLYFIRANRVEKSFFHSPLLAQDNLNKHLIDGLQQGKKTMLPIVSIHDKFKPFMQDWLSLYYNEKAESPLMLLPEIDTANNLAEILTNKNSHLTVAIGPEGGWVDFEIELMESIGFQKFTLGDWTLRVEHALTATLAQIELLK